MPFALKIQPVDFSSPVGPSFLKAGVKWRLKRFLERPFSNVSRIGGAEKAAAADGGNDQMRSSKDDDSGGLEPSSACLANMVKDYIEDSGHDGKQNNCFSSDSSDDEPDSGHANLCGLLKKLVMCSSVSERNLLADTANIYERNQLCRCKLDEIRDSITDGLRALGYDASSCKSRWEQAPTYPAGEYEYVDVIKEDERLIVDVDFRAEFKIARPTKKYTEILKILPKIFVGKADRLEKIVNLVSGEAKQSLKKNRMAFPPWRRAGYVKSKWLSPNYTRTVAAPAPPQFVTPPPLTRMDSSTDSENPVMETTTSPVIAGVKSPASCDCRDAVFSMSEDEEAE